jgi:uncharacterized protein
MGCRAWFLIVACWSLALAGCASHVDRLAEIRRAYYAGDLAASAATIQKCLKRPRHEADVLKLEGAMVDLTAGRPREAEQALREVRDHFDAFESRSAGESVASLLSDDNAKSYPGEDYEKVLIRAFLAIANLMQGGHDAEAYGLQIIDKQQQIIQSAVDKDGSNPKIAYKQVALGPYLRGMIREETHANYDDAARSSAMVVSWQPDFAYGSQDLERVQRGRHSAPGHGVMYVFALVGHGPYKQEAIELPSSAALLIADRIVSNNSTYSLPPTIAPIKVPKVVVPPASVSFVRVAVDRRNAGSTATITDVGQMAARQYEAIYPRVIATAVARRVVKKSVIYGTKEAIGGRRNTLLNFGLDVAGVAWEATEAADTRCWGLLPDKIQVLRVELPAGAHQVALSAIGPYGAGPEALRSVTISDGRNSYLLANFPDNRLVGTLLTSAP